MRQSICNANLQKIFTTCFVMKLFEGSREKLFMAFNYSYSHAAKFKNDLPCKFVHLKNYFIRCLSTLKSG